MKNAPRILVIDDDQMILDLAKAFLENITDRDVFTANGTYTPTEEGSYTNAGGLTYLPSTTDKGFDIKFSLYNGVWTKNRVDLNIEFDTTPTEGSIKAVTSEGVADADKKLGIELNGVNFILGKSLRHLKKSW